MKKVLLLSSAICLLSNTSAFSYDFSENIYGKANIKIGSSYEHVEGDILKENQDDRKMEMLAKAYGFDMDDIGNTDDLFNVDISAGYDFYFKVAKKIHLFAGTEITARIPVNIKTRNMTDQKNYFSADIKGGVRIHELFSELSKKLDFQLYGVFGYALLERLNKNFMGTGKNEAEKVNALNYGVGFDMMYDFNKYFGIIGGVEYKRVKALEKTAKTGFILETNQVEFKIGFLFL